MAMVSRNIIDLSIRKIPMLKPLIALVIGIWYSAYMLGEKINVLYILLPLIVILFFLVFWLNKKNQVLRYLYSSLLFVFFILVGIYIHLNSKDYLSNNYFFKDNFKGYVGIVIDEPVEKEKTIRFPVKVFQAISHNGEVSNVKGKAMLSIRKDSLHKKFQYGDRVVFGNNFRPVQPVRNPYEFDYARYLSLQGIWHLAYLPPQNIIKIDSWYGNPIIAQSLALRNYLLQKFSRYVKNEEAYDVAVALLFGYRSQIDPTTVQAFKNTGTIHVLSVSGLHVSLVFIFLHSLLKWLDSWRFGKFLRIGFILLFIWAYVILTGMSPPILRAGIMISFVILSQLIQRHHSALNSLISSAFLILLVAPNYLFDIGFQLSYMALIGILLGYPMLKEAYSSPYRYVQAILDVIYVSLVAQLFTLPLLLYYFGEFPNYFLLANLFITLPATLLMYIGVVLAISPFSFINVWLGVSLDYLITFTIKGLRFIEHLPASILKGIAWNLPLTILLVICIGLFFIAWNYRDKKSFFVGWIVGIFILLGTYFIQVKRYTSPRLRVYQVGADLAIAYAYNGRCTLYSSLDSLHHPKLLYAVHPELQHLCKFDLLTYQQISNLKRQNSVLQLGDKRILILEDKIQQIPLQVDIILWRKNNYTTASSLKSLTNLEAVILDGSNSDRRIKELQDSLRNIRIQSYILKNNFAYVWNKER